MCAASVSADLVANETGGAMSLLLSRDTEAPLYTKGSVRNHTYASLLVDFIPVLKSANTTDDTLFDVLGLMRGCIYLNDPWNPSRSPETYQASWRAYIGESWVIILCIGHIIDNLRVGAVHSMYMYV